MEYHCVHGCGFYTTNLEGYIAHNQRWCGGRAVVASQSPLDQLKAQLEAMQRVVESYGKGGE